jgi:hypothetical protein
MDFGVFYQVLDDARKADATLIRDLARDLLDERAANARLTAEVWRLRGALVKVRAHTAHTKASPDELHIGLLASIERIADAALSLPTHAPEATNNGK